MNLFFSAPSAGQTAVLDASTAVSHGLGFRSPPCDQATKLVLVNEKLVGLQVLNVEQAAVLLIIAHPYHPDCLAIANLMAQNQRNVTSGTDVRP